MKIGNQTCISSETPGTGVNCSAKTSEHDELYCQKRSDYQCCRVRVSLKTQLLREQMLGTRISDKIKLLTGVLSTGPDILNVATQLEGVRADCYGTQHTDFYCTYSEISKNASCMQQTPPSALVH